MIPLVCKAENLNKASIHVLLECSGEYEYKVLNVATQTRLHLILREHDKCLTFEFCL